MGLSDKQKVEDTLRQLAERGEVDRLMSLATETYGSELFGFIASLIGRRNFAEDVFQDFLVHVWNALPRFEWRSSFRVWAYQIARMTAYQALRSPNREQPLSTEDQASLPAHLSRSVTAEWRKTESKDRFWAACEALPETDRELIVLRTRSGLSFNAITDVMFEDLTPDARKKKAAALRKRYERVKSKLREELTNPRSDKK